MLKYDKNYAAGRGRKCVASFDSWEMKDDLLAELFRSAQTSLGRTEGALGEVQEAGTRIAMYASVFMCLRTRKFQNSV